MKRHMNALVKNVSLNPKWSHDHPTIGEITIAVSAIPKLRKDIKVARLVLSISFWKQELYDVLFIFDNASQRTYNPHAANT